MKKLAVLASAAMLAASLAVLPSHAAEINEKVLKHTPVIDGKIDARIYSHTILNTNGSTENSGASASSSLMKKVFQFTETMSKQQVTSFGTTNVYILSFQ